MNLSLKHGPADAHMITLATQQQLQLQRAASASHLVQHERGCQSFVRHSTPEFVSFSVFCHRLSCAKDENTQSGD